jgi:hypothetical protein
MMKRFFLTTATAVLLCSTPALSAPEPPRLGQAEIYAQDAQNVPEVTVSRQHGLLIDLSQLNDPIEKIETSGKGSADRFGSSSIRVRMQKTDQPMLLYVLLASKRVLQLQLLATDTPEFSRLDVVPNDSAVTVPSTALLPRRKGYKPLVQEPPSSALLPVPAVSEDQGESIESLPPAPTEETVNIPKPSRDSSEDPATLANAILAGLPVAIDEGHIGRHSWTFRKIQSAVRSLRYGHSQTVEQAAARYRIKTSVLNQLIQWGTRS